MLTINQNLIAILKKHEGLRLTAYDDLQPNVTITNKDQVKGTLTIGYGRTKGVFVGQKITEQQAEQFLTEDLQPFIDAVNDSVKNPLNINMFNALVSLAYNIGASAFKKSTLLKLLNEEKPDYIKVSEQFAVWNKVGGQIMQGLVNRRNAEKELFLRDRFVLQMIIPAVSIVKKNAIKIPLILIAVILAFFIFRR